MTQTTVDAPLIFREYEPDDFPGLQELWRDAGWGELSQEMYDLWWNHNPLGLLIPVLAQAPDGKIIGLITMLPHRVTVGHEVVEGARLMANIVSSDFKQKFDLKTHPVMGLWDECCAAAARRGYPLLFALPKVSWISVLRLAASRGIKDVPHARIACMERPVPDAPALIDGVTAQPMPAFSAEHTDLWEQARVNQQIGCAIHRDLETLNYRNSEHRNFELVSKAGTLVGYATVRKDGLLYDIVMIERDLYDPALAALLNAIDGAVIPDLKIMSAPYYSDPADLGFAKSTFRFGFAAEAIDDDFAQAIAVENWYLAGGG